MSTLWTPSGEHPVPREPAGAPGSPSTGNGGRDEGRSSPGATAGAPGQAEAAPEDARAADADLEAVREELLRAPAEVVVANHAMGLWELAALHLSSQPPQLPQAQLAIDAMSALVEGLRGRLGEAESSLSDGLAQIRMAFVQIANASRATQGSQTQGSQTQGSSSARSEPQSG